MSAEGSVSSQINDFDLYSSIDARTEEFLRLSRKKQMKQGCACAAISTIVAIAVIICIILIYQYSTSFDSATRAMLTPNWIKLMNTSVNDLPFAVKLDKSKIGLDPTTIKFLPLILNTLKKNKYFDKTLEDTSSLTTTDILDTRPYTKNIFSDTRNWMKVPTSRFYTIEYKTSPIAYFRNPTRNIDYYKKVRKIRDYQRVMDYVDKMISERVTSGSTVPLTKKWHSFYSKTASIESTTPMTKLKDSKTKMKINSTDQIKTASSVRKLDCNCPKRMSDLLKKIIYSLQSLLPNFSNNNITHIGNCTYNNSKKITIEPTKKGFKSKLLSIAKLYDNTTPSVKKTRSTIKPKTSVTYDSDPVTSSLKLDYTLSNIIELLKPSIITRNRISSNDLLSYKTTIMKDFVESTQENYKSEENVTSSVNINNNVNLLPASVTTIGKYILKVNLNKTKTSTFSILAEKEYEDYIDTTTKVIKYDERHGDNKLELVNGEPIVNKNNQTLHYNTNSKVLTDFDSKQTSLNFLDDTFIANPSTTSPTTDNKLIDSWEYNDTTTIPTNTEYFTRDYDGFNPTSTMQSITKTFKIEQSLKSEDITLEDELNKKDFDEVSPEESIKHLEDVIRKLNSSEISIPTTEGAELYEWKLVNFEDYRNGYNIINSMLPQNRASYLEIQRNDWKPEEHQDYDNNNINNFLFE